MSDSETSSEVEVKYQSRNGENLLEEKRTETKPVSSSSDYYFNMIANPNKIVQVKPIESESSELNDLLHNTETSKSSKSSRSSKSGRSSSDTSKSSKKSSSSESKATYEKIPIPVPSFNTGPTKMSTGSQSNKPLNTSNIKPVPQEPQKVPERELTPQEIRMKKIELIRKLCELKQKGYELTKEYGMDSSIEEMEYEYELLKSFANKRNGIKMYKNIMLNGVSIIEFLNDKYDPFDFQLSGWSDHMSVDIDNWDDVWEDIYEKYKGTGKQMPPEIKLAYLFFASAAAFHFSKSHTAQLPGLESMLASNPGLLSKIINPGKKETSQFMTQQEINIERQKEEFKKKDTESKMKQNQQMQQMQQMQQQQQLQQMQQMQQQIEQLKKQNSEPQAANAKPMPMPPTIPANQFRTNVPTIRAPDEVKDILNRIHNIQPSMVNQGTIRNTDTQDDTTSNNDRLLSDATMSDNTPGKKRQVRKPRKANISIF